MAQDKAQNAPSDIVGYDSASSSSPMRSPTSIMTVEPGWLEWETLGNPSDQHRKSCSAGSLTVSTVSCAEIKALLLTPVEALRHLERPHNIGDIMLIRRTREPKVPAWAYMLSDDGSTIKTVGFPYNNEDGGAQCLDVRNFLGDKVEGSTIYQRWPTASRSSVVLRKTPDLPAIPGFDRKRALVPILAPKDSRLSSSFQRIVRANGDEPICSVKTGVQYVGRSDESLFHKDILEGNSIHATIRTSWIDKVDGALGGLATEARYLLEELTVLIYTYAAGEEQEAEEKGQVSRPPGIWDGYQIRDIAGGERNAWFPALAVPSEHGRLFTGGAESEAPAWWGRKLGNAVGRAKAEMLIRYGLQHHSCNAQNFLWHEGERFPLLLRDIGDTIVNNDIIALLQVAGLYADCELLLEEGTPLGMTLTPPPASLYDPPFMINIGLPIAFYRNAWKEKRELSAMCMLHGLDGYLEFLKERLDFLPGVAAGNAQPPVPLHVDKKSQEFELGKKQGEKLAERRRLNEMSTDELHQQYWFSEYFMRKNLENPRNPIDEDRIHFVEALIGLLLIRHLHSDIGRRKLVDYHRTRASPPLLATLLSSASA